MRLAGKILLIKDFGSGLLVSIFKNSPLTLIRATDLLTGTYRMVITSQENHCFGSSQKKGANTFLEVCRPRDSSSAVLEKLQYFFFSHLTHRKETRWQQLLVNEDRGQRTEDVKRPKRYELKDICSRENKNKA